MRDVVASLQQVARALAGASFLFAVVLGAVPAIAGTLPLAVDGQPLPSLAPMLERVTPAVVNVNSKTRVRVRDPFADDPFFRHFFGMPNVPRERVQQSLGSGVIVDAARGYVLTNNHVIDGADDIAVTLADGRTFKATKVGTDADSDVAVIRIDADALTALPLGDSDQLRVGDFAVAVGNPFGLGQTVTTGIVSALERTGVSVVGIQRFIQTDASINPGNSGGALVNLRGELIGINTAIYSPSGGNVGIGFAIPARIARDVMQQLIAHGEVRRGALGVQAQDLDDEMAPLLKLTAGRGAVITRVTDGSPAAQAGLRPGDVVTAVNGHAVNNRAELASAEALLPLGGAVTLTVTRDGEVMTLSTTMKETKRRTRNGADIDPRLDGLALTDLSETLIRQGTNGVGITAVVPGSRAAQTGLQPGDVIAGVNRREIGDLDDLESLAGQHPRQLVLTIVRGNRASLLLMP